MISVEDIQKSSIRGHYQLGSLFYRLLWGSHIHHGLWSGDESASQAQLQLTDALADLASLGPDADVLDVGSGLGGSAIRMAKQRGCRVTGITLSPVQRYWSAISAMMSRTGRSTRFITADAETVHFPNAVFDVVWSIECTEHLFDKPVFFDRAAGWLRPGGRIAVCAWFEGEDARVPGHQETVEEVCRRFACPSLATRWEYAAWLETAGMSVIHNLDWTDRVTKTWEICKRRVERTGVRHIAKILNHELVAFIDGFDVLRDAYRNGAMQYGAIVAEKRQ